MSGAPQRPPHAAPTPALDRHDLRGGEVRVAVDGTHASLAATDWAAREAGVLRQPLRLVHVVGWPHAGDGATRDDVSELSAEVLAEAAARALGVDGRVEVVTETREGPLGPTLTRLAADPHVLVVGHRTMTGFAGMVLGSVAVGVATRAAGPVVVVPDAPDGWWRSAQPRVVIGIQGAGSTTSALAFGFGYAARHRFSVEVIVAEAADDSVSVDRAGALTEETARGYSEVTWSRRRVAGPAVGALAGAAADAALLVVGCRTRVDGESSLLDSVSRGALFLARCPVAVV